MAIKVGKLRQRCTLLSPTQTKGDQGGAKNTFASYGTTWCEVRSLNAKEYIEARATLSEVTHLVRIRYRTGVKPTHQVQQGSRTFSIEAVMPADSMNIELHLLCKEVSLGT